MSEAQSPNKTQKEAKTDAWATTIIHTILLPLTLMFALLSLTVAHKQNIALSFVTLYVSLFFCTPLSIPFTLYFVWSRYFKKKYQQMHHCRFITLHTFCITQFLAALADLIFYPIPIQETMAQYVFLTTLTITLCFFYKPIRWFKQKT